MADPIADLAAQIKRLQDKVDILSQTSQLGNSSIETGDTTINLSDAAATAAGIPATLAGLQALLDTNEEALTATRADVEAAIEAAKEASDAGIAAGEEASAAADDALAKAQEALDAAAAAGGGATYSPNPPTAGTPGVNGQQWFVWDSNYNVTAYYVYDGAASAWVQSAYTDEVIGNLDAGSITSGYLGADRIAAASLTAAVLAADTISSREIAADAILARNIKAAEITGDKIAARTVAAGNIVAGTITGNEIKANSITADQIAANSITANEINLATLNGKTINGVAVTGGSLSTIKDPNAPFGGTIRIANSVVEARNSSAGYPHYTQLFATQDGALSIYSEIALNTGGTSTRQVLTKFATAPSQFPWSGTEPIMGISASQPVEFQRVYTGNVYVGPSGGSAATASITSDGVHKGTDFRLPDGTTILTGFLRMNIPTTTGTSGQALTTGAVTQLSNMVRHSDSIRADVGTWLQSYSGNSVQLKTGVYLITTNFVTTTRVSSRTFLSIFRDGTEIQRAPGSGEDQFSGVVTVAVAAGATASIDMRFYQASGSNMYAQRGDLNITKIG